MPIRLVCPSCSATLSVKDEYAGRAVKCPKCAGVIPAAQPGAPAAPSKASAALPPPPPPPAPEPAPAPFEAIDEPATPKPKITGRPTGKPVAKSSDDMDDDRPAKKRGRDDDRDDERPARRGARGGDADEDDDRPSRGRRKRGDDDDRPAKKKGGGGVMIVLILCGTLLLCCGGGGFAVYYYVIKPGKEFVQKVGEDIKTWNWQVSESNYKELEVGDATRAQADTKLGAGRVATDADLTKAFAADPGRADEWKALVGKKRVVVWQSGEDYVVAAFNPTADAGSRLQMKEWRPKSGAAQKDGELDDAKFLTAFPPGGGPGIPVEAKALAQAYKDGPATADPKYKKKVLLVEGKITFIDFSFSNEPEIIMEGVRKDGGGVVETRVRFVPSETNKVLGLSHGQTVKVKGKCSGFDILYVDLEKATLDSFTPDPNPVVSAKALTDEYTKDADAANEKYSTQFLTVTGAYVESTGDGSMIVSSGKGATTKIEVSLRDKAGFHKPSVNVKPGDRVKIKGSYTQFGGSKNAHLAYAWIVP